MTKIFFNASDIGNISLVFFRVFHGEGVSVSRVKTKIKLGGAGYKYYHPQRGPSCKSVMKKTFYKNRNVHNDVINVFLYLFSGIPISTGYLMTDSKYRYKKFIINSREWHFYMMKLLLNYYCIFLN